MSFIRELPDEKYDRQYGDIALFRRLFSYIGKRKPTTFVLILMFMLTGAATNLSIPYLVKYVISIIETSILSPSGHQYNWMFYTATALVVLFYAFQWLSNFAAMYYSAQLSGDMIRNIRKDCFDTILLQDQSFWDEHKSGKVVSRVTNDTNQIANMTQITTSFIINLFVMIAVFILLFLTNVTLSLVTLAVVPVLFIVAIGIRVFARKTSKTWRKTIAILNANVAESISGIEVTKAFNQEREGFKRFEEINMRNYKAAVVRAFGISVFYPIIEALFGIGTFLILFYGGKMAIIQQTISVATLYFFVLMLNRFFMPLMQITRFFNQFEAGLAAVERIFSLMDSEPTVVEHPTPTNVNKLQGVIDFENVTFYYKPAEPLFRDFSLHIPAGETLAVVGKTGAGKSTLVSLLARFYDVKDGKLLIDGTDIRKYKFQEYRRQLGIVLQENILFSGTIEENIRYGKPDATREEIIEAAKTVYAWEFIQSLPKGLNTEVGEKGTKLSLGQRQLLSFARTLLSDPKILVLDEATSAIDAYTESLIQEALKVLLEGRTAIIIAHRLTTVENADRIIVLEDAQIVEEGTHRQLMDQRGTYYQLYDTYFRHQSLDYIEKASQLT